jgi:hypothetical protein
LDSKTTRQLGKLKIKIMKILKYKNNFSQIIKNQKGIAALLTVVVVSAAAMIIAYSATMLGIGETEMGYMAQRATEALSVADGCMEETLNRLRKNNSYVGGTLNLGEGSCIINITGTGATRAITIIGTVDDYNKKIYSDITFLSGRRIRVDSWQELDD